MVQANATNRPILVLSGASPLARMMVDILHREMPDVQIVVVEERRKVGPLILEFLRRRIRQRGVASALDALAMRLFQVLLPAPATGMTIAPDLVVQSVNDDRVAELADRLRPQAILLSICSLLSAEQLQRLNVPVFNVHNGLNPRYRGSGNVNALAEDYPSAVGVTLHRVDAGIDTGKIVARRKLDPVAEGIPLSKLDNAAFSAGIGLAVAHLRGYPPLDTTGPDIDGFYPYPGLSVWLRARRNLRRRQASKAALPLAPAWREDFDRLANDQTKPLSERLHWSTTELTARREATVAAFVRLESADGYILDVGCGDASLAKLVGPGRYFGCDGCPPFLGHAKSGRVFAAEASALPVREGSFDIVLAVGLFQHLDEAQPVADEMRRAAHASGSIIISTLRQFSGIELAMIWLMSIGDSKRRRLATLIWRRRHGPELLDGGPVAKRYKPSEIARMFGLSRRSLRIAYLGGLFGPLFAREIVVALTLPEKRRPTRVGTTPTP
jgi:SAM-dependent methyltransferase